MKLTNLPPPLISPFLRRNKIQPHEILNNLSNITGFLLCDIIATEKANKFSRINWPPIFSKKKLNFEILPSWMKLLVNKASFPKISLVQSMSEKKILLHTEMVKFYLSNGFVIPKIYTFIEFEPSKCFEIFYNALYEQRVAATIAKNEAKATAIKLTGNSPYGKVKIIIPINLRIFNHFDNLLNNVSLNK